MINRFSKLVTLCTACSMFVFGLTGVGSCTTTNATYRPAPPVGYHYYYKIIQDEGYTKMGVSINNSDKWVDLIPCVYDTIYCIGDCRPFFYIAIDGNVPKIFHMGGTEIVLDGYSIHNIGLISDTDSIDSKSYLSHKLLRATTDNGNLYIYGTVTTEDNTDQSFYFGPYDKFVEGKQGYFFESDGKWGYASIKPECGYNKDDYYLMYGQIIDPEADRIIQITDSDLYGGFWLYLKDNEWHIIDRNLDDRMIDHAYAELMLSDFPPERPVGTLSLEHLNEYLNDKQ